MSPAKTAGRQRQNLRIIVERDWKDIEIANIEVTALLGNRCRNDMALGLRDVDHFIDLTGRRDGKNLSVIRLDRIKLVIRGNEAVENTIRLKVPPESGYIAGWLWTNWLRLATDYRPTSRF